MKRVVSFTVSFVILAVLLASCAALPSNQMAPAAGDIVRLSAGTVAWGLQAAKNGAPGTYVFNQGINYLVVWTYRGKSAAGFYSFTEGGRIIDAAKLLEGNIASSTTVRELIDSIIASGWKQVPASTAAPAISKILGGGPVVSGSGSGMGGATILIFTMGLFPNGFASWFDTTFKPSEIQQ